MALSLLYVPYVSGFLEQRLGRCRFPPPPSLVSGLGKVLGGHGLGGPGVFIVLRSEQNVLKDFVTNRLFSLGVYESVFI